MKRKLKLIWDFRGYGALRTAQHHEIHLNEYVKHQNSTVLMIGHETINELHSLTFIVVNEEDMKPFRDQLKPHRGEWHDE